jgi:3-methyladenine DNA glycosylase/8-oxoguanine DNA glycosylase
VRSAFTTAVPAGFDLARAVCSYGYFILAPNRWDGPTRTLHRPLRGEGERLIKTAIVAAPGKRRQLLVRCAVKLRPRERELLTQQIRRMLRLDEDYRAWRRLHPTARRRRFDRLFRSPTLFEDMVKTITGCNVTWPNTMRMNSLLCARVGGGGFPTPAMLAAVRPDWLKRHCKVGYRAGRIVRLARAVASGRLDLARFEDAARSPAELFDELLMIEGIGPYAAANILQLLGRYDRLAIDSETYRHFREVHRAPTPRSPGGLRRLHQRIERYYARFAPYQFLAYWFELWHGYAGHAGDPRMWEAEIHGPTFTAARMRKRT